MLLSDARSKLMNESASIDCSVICDTPAGPVVLVLTVSEGATVADALGLARAQLGETLVDWQQARVGVWGQESARDRVLASGDRVEVYRLLPNDPKVARRQRAKGARLRRPGR